MLLLYHGLCYTAKSWLAYIPIVETRGFTLILSVNPRFTSICLGVAGLNPALYGSLQIFTIILSFLGITSHCMTNSILRLSYHGNFLYRTGRSAFVRYYTVCLSSGTLLPHVRWFACSLRYSSFAAYLMFTSFIFYYLNGCYHNRDEKQNQKDYAAYSC